MLVAFLLEKGKPEHPNGEQESREEDTGWHSHSWKEADQTNERFIKAINVRRRSRVTINLIPGKLESLIKCISRKRDGIPE